jgi:hypothetical protein
MKKIKTKSGAAISDVIRLRGCFEIALLGPNHEVLDYRKVDNVVVTAGRSYVLSRIQSSTPQTDVINAIAVGTSTTGPAVTDTVLVSEALRLSIATFITGGLGSNPPFWQAQQTFGTGQANTTLGEAGIFNATGAAAQTMLSRVTFATISKQNTNTLAISYTISN